MRHNTWPSVRHAQRPFCRIRGEMESLAAKRSLLFVGQLAKLRPIVRGTCKIRNFASPRAVRTEAVPASTTKYSNRIAAVLRFALHPANFASTSVNRQYAHF